jgi:hypothetical protein
LIAFRLPAGDYVVFRMLHIHRDQGGAYPVLEVLAWRGELQAAEALPDTPPFATGLWKSSDPGNASSKTGSSSLRTRHNLPDDPSWGQRGLVRPVRVFLWSVIDRHMAEDFGLN